MSTAIVWFQTIEGFVIASDGRKSDETGQIINEYTQKIFPVEQPDIRLAYGLAGTTGIGQSRDRMLFDFAPEVATGFDRLLNSKRKNWFDYVSTLATGLTEKLNQARAASKDTLTHATATWLFIGGFYANLQKGAHVIFQHGIEASEAEICLHPPGFNFGPFGSPKIFDLIDREDPRFLQYCQPKRNAILGLSTAIERAEKDIRAHCDTEALKIDEPNCRGIGGRVQIATVTFAEGFKWVRGFEPFSPQ